MIPPRDATDEYMQAGDRTMDIRFDIDLGELVQGHHVVGRGIELGQTIKVSRLMRDMREELAELARRASENPGAGISGINVSHRTFTPKPGDLDTVEIHQSEPQFHHEYVPGIEPAEDEADPFFWYWTLRVSDDLGTVYRDDNGGARGPSTGGLATHGSRDLGGHIPETAKRLEIGFEPPAGWVPPEPWRRQLVIDLSTRSLAK